MASSPLMIRVMSDERDQARLSVTGVLDPEVMSKLQHHLHAVLSTGARFIVLDLTGASPGGPAVDPLLLELLTQAQRRLTTRAGMISMVGMHPHPGVGRPSPPRAHRGGGPALPAQR